MKRRGAAVWGAALASAGALAWSGWNYVRSLARGLQASEDDLRAAGLTLPSEIRSHHIDVSDAGRIHAVELGHGPTVVLVHGIMLNASIFAPIIRAMSATHRVIAIDLRGHGNSLVGDEGLSMDRLARDVVEVLRALEVRNAVLLGHSMGGMVAQIVLGEYSEDVAERVSHLVLLGSSAGPASQSGPERMAFQAIDRFARKELRKRASKGEGVFPVNDAAIWLARTGFGRKPDACAVELARSVTQSTPPAVVAALLEELFCFDGRDLLAAITQSATVVVGSLDLLTPPRHARAMASSMSSVEYVQLRGLGHMIMLEAPDKLIACLEAASWRSRHPSA